MNYGIWLVVVDFQVDFIFACKARRHIQLRKL